MPLGTHTFSLTPGRINKYKGEILKHAVAMECLSRQGRHVEMPKGNSETYIARRYLPYNTSATNANTQNQFFPTATGDRANVIVQAHLTADGVTPPPESIVPVDVTAVVQQYSCLYSFTDKTYDLYEDDIPKEMIKQVGERVTLVNELILWGILRGATNQFFGGTGTTMATVNGTVTLGFLRKIIKNLQANHAVPVNTMLKASQLYGTAPVARGYSLYVHTDAGPAFKDVPGFIPVREYASGTPMEYELGSIEEMRIFLSADLPSFQDAGATVGTTGLFSTTGTNIDVYPFIVVAQDAWSQIAVRGLSALDPTYLAPGEKTKSDPLGQRGYAGTKWYKTGMVENNGWMAVGNIGVPVLT